MELKALLDSLPCDDDSIESQARRALRLVLSAGEAGERGSSDPALCPNCGLPAPSLKSPYCSEQCREVAGFVRQFRAGVQLGWILEPDKQVALGQVLWHLLGGGRPLRREISPAKARQKAIDREGGICQVCGAPATTVDHIGSGCNRPINLRPVCETCCTDKSFADQQVLTHPSAQALLKDITARIAAQSPLRICDDAETWDWREFLKQRKRRVEYH